MFAYKFISVAVDAGLATLTIAKPPVNVLDIAAMEEMDMALAALAADHSVRLLVIAAAGDKAFSAGVEVADHTPDKVERMIEIFHAVIRRIEAFAVPTIAAVNGTALGGGLEVALACDMIVAAAGAKLGQPEIKLAVFPPIAAILLPRLLPPVIANELLYGGGIITAEQALQYGLVNRVFARESFAADVAGFCKPFLENSGAALAATKKAIRLAEGKTFEPALQAVEQSYLKELMATCDAKEGLDAFMAKRKPVWQHK